MKTHKQGVVMKNKTLYDEYMKDKEFKRLMMQEDLIMDITENFCELLARIKELEREKINLEERNDKKM